MCGPIEDAPTAAETTAPRFYPGDRVEWTEDDVDGGPFVAAGTRGTVAPIEQRIGSTIPWVDIDDGPRVVAGRGKLRKETALSLREALPGELKSGTRIRVTGDTVVTAHGITGETGEIVRYTGQPDRRRTLVATDPTRRAWGSAHGGNARWVGPGDLEPADTFAPGDRVDDTRNAYFSPAWQNVGIVRRNGKENGEDTLWDVARTDGVGGTIAERHLRRHVEEEVETAVAPKFHEGQTVRVTGSGGDGVNHYLEVGSVGVVVTDESVGTLIRVEGTSARRPGKKLRQFVSPQHLEAVDAPAPSLHPALAHTPPRVTAAAELPAGLVVTDDGSILNWRGVNYVRQPDPEPAKPAPGTFGTAVVDGERRHGVIDEDGDFAYLRWDSEDGAYDGDGWTRDFSDFKEYTS